MTATSYPAKSTTFFQLIDNTFELDMRDNRGKSVRRCGHSLALALTGLVAAFCCGRDENLSRLVIHFENTTPIQFLTQQMVL